MASKPGDAPSHRELPPKRDLAALRRMASVQAHELLLMFDQLTPLDRCRLGRSHRARPISPVGTGSHRRHHSDVRWARGRRANLPFDPLPPLRDEQPVVQAPRRPGCREPPDLLGLQKRTGGKVFLVQDYKSYRYNLRSAELNAFSPNEPNFALSFQILGFWPRLGPALPRHFLPAFFIDGNFCPFIPHAWAEATRWIPLCRGSLPFL